MPPSTPSIVSRVTPSRSAQRRPDPGLVDQRLADVEGDHGAAIRSTDAGR